MAPAAGLWVAMFAAMQAAPPRVAVHPLVVVGGDAKAIEQSRTDFLIEAARQPIDMVSRGQVQAVLERQPGATCVEHEGCLERLCRETAAAYALLVSLVL